MKKYIYIILFFALVTNWDIISGILGVSNNKYTIGDYTNKKWHSGHNGYKEAIKESDNNAAPIIIYLYTDWCQYCKKFESELLTNHDVQSNLAKFVKVKINPDISKKDKELYQKLNGKGFPTIMFQYGENSKLTHVRAPYKKSGNNWKLMTANEFITMLHKYGT